MCDYSGKVMYLKYTRFLNHQRNNLTSHLYRSTPKVFHHSHFLSDTLLLLRHHCNLQPNRNNRLQNRDLQSLVSDSVPKRGYGRGLTRTSRGDNHHPNRAKSASSPAQTCATAPFSTAWTTLAAYSLEFMAFACSWPSPTACKRPLDPMIPRLLG